MDNVIERKTYPRYQYDIYWEAAGSPRLPNCAPLTEFSHEENGQWMMRYGEYRVWEQNSFGHHLCIVEK